MERFSGWIKRIIIILLIIVVFCAAALFIASILGGDRDLGKAIDFSGHTLSGEKVTLSQNFGKKGTVLCFYDTKSDYGDSMLSAIKAQITERYGKDLDVVVVAMDGEKTASELSAYMKEKGVLFEHTLLDADGSISALYNITSSPITYFINKEGSVRASVLGTLTPTKMQKYIAMI